MSEPSEREPSSGPAEELLQPGEPGVPEGVMRTVRWFEQRGLWFALSRNLPATSCRDAVSKRWRLGHEGIELWSELKSFLGRYRDVAGSSRLFLAHCRGDRELDLARVQAALDCPGLPERLEEAEIETLGLAYGLINPFESWCSNRSAGIQVARQVFDSEIVRPIRQPGTMMTNAGDLTWGVEFDPSAMVRAIDGALVVDIARPDFDAEPAVWGPREQHPIAILTGNAPESGMLLWSEANRCLRDLMGSRFCGDVSLPEVTVRSLPALGLTMELERREREVWATLEPEIERLCAQGARYLTVACNTTHYFTAPMRRVCAAHGTELISMPEAVGAWLRARGVERIALVGIPLVSDLGSWSAYREPLTGIGIEPLSLRAKQRLQSLAYRVKNDGATEAGLNRLRDILRDEVQSRHVVLALTELSMLMELHHRRARGDRVLVDPLALCAEALACRYLGLSFPPPRDEAW